MEEKERERLEEREMKERGEKGKRERKMKEKGSERDKQTHIQSDSDGKRERKR